MRFFLVDRVEELIAGKFARGVKNLTLTEDYFEDHFPDHPVFPGTLLVEALAQLGGFLVEMSLRHDEHDLRRAVLSQIDKTKFYVPMRPGDQLELKCALLSELGEAARVQGEANVRGKRAAQATLTFNLFAVHSPRVHEQRRQLYQFWTRNLKEPCPIP